ncbi:MAG: 3-oxoacyl-ACP synthase [Bacteroidales bacterium]|nr:3-oxoacyl-ACP synthase [Bacteroidales bacterium]
MTRIDATNITSPLGLTTAENYAAVKRGETGLKVMDGCLGVPARFCVGIFDESSRAALRMEGCSWFESLVIHSIQEALSHSTVQASSPRTLLVIGTSTAGVEELGEVPEKDRHYLAPGLAAQKVARCLGFVTTPIVVSNACISGATAQMLAERLMEARHYDAAVVCGADVLSSFVLAGFDSFKALSPTVCRPFDLERLGLNIGECAATMVLKNDEQGEGWRIVDGCLNNDAYHVSAPIPSGDGIFRSIQKILTPELKAAMACVTAHGTATMFNDQMESKGIANAGLGDIPTTAYKPHFGHTFGASGVVEPIITMCSLDEGLILPVMGFEEIGVSGKIKVCAAAESTDKRTFIKTQSGFGSCNGSVIYSRESWPAPARVEVSYETVRQVSITPESLRMDGADVPVEARGAALVSELYKKYLSDGSRFFKMDLFSRLAYVGTGLLAKDALEGIAPEEIAILLFTVNGSVLADRKHLSTYTHPDEYYPSPSVFINTLPNVVLGEIAMKNTIKGETTLVMLPERDEPLKDRIVAATLAATRPAAVMAGWVDCTAEDAFYAALSLLKIKE